MHLAHTETASTTLYAVPIIFDRNAHSVPAIVRVADIMWGAASVSGLYRGSTIAPPTSVYSLPLTLVDRVGGWDCDSEAIGEDLHMYLKCFFALNGNLTVRTIMSPVSSTNVTRRRLRQGAPRHGQRHARPIQAGPPPHVGRPGHGLRPAQGRRALAGAEVHVARLPASPQLAVRPLPLSLPRPPMRYP